MIRLRSELVKVIFIAFALSGCGPGPQLPFTEKNSPDDKFTFRIAVSEPKQILGCEFCRRPFYVYATMKNNISSEIINVFEARLENDGVPFSKQNIFDAFSDDTYTYYHSYDNPKLYNLELKVTMHEAEKEIISILDIERELRVFVETKKNNLIGWKIENKYWVDENYFVWKSEQSISPRLPKLIIEVTKKPSR